MKTRNIFLAMAAAVVMLFTGCSKDIDLVGTTWQSNTLTGTYSEAGLTADATLTVTITFKDATNYDMVADMNVTFMGQTMPFGDSQSGTYTFDGENGVFDGEQAFSYDKKNKTLVINIDDPEISQSFGVTTITLTQQK